MSPPLKSALKGGGRVNTAKKRVVIGSDYDDEDDYSFDPRTESSRKESFLKNLSRLEELHRFGQRLDGSSGSYEQSRPSTCSRQPSRFSSSQCWSDVRRGDERSEERWKRSRNRTDPWRKRDSDDSISSDSSSDLFSSPQRPRAGLEEGLRDFRTATDGKLTSYLSGALSDAYISGYENAKQTYSNWSSQAPSSGRSYNYSSNYRARYPPVKFDQLREVFSALSEDTSESDREVASAFDELDRYHAWSDAKLTSDGIKAASAFSTDKVGTVSDWFSEQQDALEFYAEKKKQYNASSCSRSKTTSRSRCEESKTEFYPKRTRFAF